MINKSKTVLILGANSDVAKQCILLYLKKEYFVIAASRNLESLQQFVEENDLNSSQILLEYF